MKTYAAPILVLFLLSACGADLSNLEQSQTAQVQDGLKGKRPSKKDAKKGLVLKSTQCLKKAMTLSTMGTYACRSYSWLHRPRRHELQS